MYTDRLELLAGGPEAWRALLESEEAYRALLGVELADGVRDFLVGGELSPEFRAKLEAGGGPDPWTFGFAVVRRDESLVIGMAGYKGRPVGGVAEIAYGIAPGHEGRGYATEVAAALCEFARAHGVVRTIRAHTLPERNASTRVLEKCGFAKRCEVEDPEDGLVWRWEKDLAPDRPRNEGRGMNAGRPVGRAPRRQAGS